MGKQQGGQPNPYSQMPGGSPFGPQYPPQFRAPPPGMSPSTGPNPNTVMGANPGPNPNTVMGVNPNGANPNVGPPGYRQQALNAGMNPYTGTTFAQRGIGPNPGTVMRDPAPGLNPSSGVDPRTIMQFGGGGPQTGTGGVNPNTINQVNPSQHANLMSLFGQLDPSAMMRSDQGYPSVNPLLMAMLGM